MVIAEIGAIERSTAKENPHVPAYQPIPQTTKNKEIASKLQSTGQVIPSSSTLKNLVQKKLAISAKVHSNIQSTQTLMQRIDESQASRAQKAAEAEAATTASTTPRAPAEQFKAIMTSPSNTTNNDNQSELTKIAQQKLAINVKVNSSIQGTQKLMQSIDANQTAQTQQNTNTAVTQTAITSLQRVPTLNITQQKTVLATPATTPLEVASSSLKNLVQQNMEATIAAQTNLQSAQTLIQSIDASNSPRTQQEAAAKANADERRTRAQATALSISAMEQAQKQGVKPISPYADTSGITNPNKSPSDLALHPDTNSPQSQQQQQQQQLLASIGQGGIFGQTIANVSGLSSVTGISRLIGYNFAPLFGTIKPITPIAGESSSQVSLLPSLDDSSSSGVISNINTGTKTKARPHVVATNISAMRVGVGLFNTRGNLQEQCVHDFTLLRQTQAQNVQQALAFNQSLALSTSGQLQPSLFLQLGIGTQLFKLMMFAHRRAGSLGIFYEANCDPHEIQAIESDPTLQAAQNTSQLLVALYLEYFFALLATIRRHLEMRLGKKLGANTANTKGNEDDAKGHSEHDAERSELQEMSAELDYIKRNRRSLGTNQDFHYSMILPHS